MKTLLSFLFILFLAAPLSRVWALAPIESLVLGNFSESYSENESDPLNYVFARDKYQNKDRSTNAGHKRELALYRGFYEEGKNTLNYCKGNREIRYSTEWQKVQVMRSMLSEIQYIGLDITSRALPQYAKALEFTRDEYNNLITGLVGNYCSANLSIISKKELLNNLLVKFDKENNFKLPNVTGNPYFPLNMDAYLPPKLALEQEFKYTVKLFQSICSWGGNPTNPGLLVPILKNPALMSFFTRQMNNQAIDWKELNNTLFLKEDNNTVQVWCDNLICRKTFRDNFYHKIYYSVGGTNLSEDLRRLYCEEFRTLDYKPADSDDRLSKIMNSRTFDEENFINSQFIALLTGVPDFLLRADKFSRGEDVLRSSVDYTWDKWAKAQTDMLNRELYFEEPLTLELVERGLYFKPQKAQIKAAFDVSLGEFDRINQRTGKVRVMFNILIQRSFLHYYRETLKNLDPRNTAEKERLLKRFKIQMTKDVTLARDKFIIPPWKGDLEALIASELTTQLLLISDGNFKMPTIGFEPITVELNYGLFALKYINHQKTVQNARAINSK
ncbi:MAG: hypothetical protein PHY93_04065 [Bacteriovorax sp.]|nr:hypothetical protein [Bacteriovorax sp.]